MEGSPPEDPSVLDTNGPSAGPPATEVQQNNIPQSPPVTHPQRTEPPRHQLLSASHHQQQPAQPRLQPPAPVPAPAPAPAPPQNDIFSLDFHAPSQPAQQPTQPAPPKNAKQDILSLFSAPSPNPATTIPVQQNLWGQSQQPVQQQPVQGMMGQTGAGMWGVSSGWNPPQPQPQANAWGNFTSGVPQQPQQQGSLGMATQPASNSGFGAFQQSAAFSTTSIWANNNTPTTTTANNQPKDAFDDIWGGFK
jgi:stromal membrane-associated protein